MNTEYLQWHPAFYAAAQIEFSEEREKLYFEDEHQLSKKPLLIDTLIIKVRKGGRIRKNIGKIFREHNIIEYKSPEDYLSINDYYKVLGYACLYQADTERVCQISPEEITITFVCTHFPKKLVTYLINQKKLTVICEEAGIYYIEGAVFPVQMIVVSRLSPEHNFWLSRLRKDLTISDDIEMCDAIRELFADELKAGIEQGVEQGIERGIILTKTVFRMNAQGSTPEEIAKACGITTDEVQKILTD